MNGIYIRKRNGKKRNLVIFVAILIILFFSLVFFSDSITNSSLRAMRPFQAAIWSASDPVFDWTFSVIRKGDIKRELDLLLGEKEMLTEEVIRLRSVREENEILRRALDLGMDKDFDLVMANVLGKDILEEIIIIDRGSNDGISEGMPVVNENRVAVGRIGEVFDDFSRVVLITHEESAIEAEVQGREIIGLMEGMGDSDLRLTLIPKDKEIAEGDALITAPLSGIFPRGLFIGLIRSVDKRDCESFQEADVAPFFSIRRLKKVFVITNQR